MSPMDLQHLHNLIKNHKTFQVGSRGCSFLCTYWQNHWMIWSDRARLSMTAEVLLLSVNCPGHEYEYGNKMIGRIGKDVVFELDLNDYIKITEDLPRRGAE